MVSESQLLTYKF